MGAPYASPTVQRRARVVAFLALVTRPCGHDPADLREESTGIECATCGRAYRVKADRGAP